MLFRRPFIARIFALLALLFASSVQAQKTAEVTAIAALAKLQATWDSMKSYRSQFKQVVVDKRLGDRDESDGVLTVIKPDKLRWESKTDQSVQILSGKRLTNVHINRRRLSTTVDIWEDAAKNLDSRTLKLLAGQLKFADLYRPELLKETPKSLEIKMKPKSPGAETLIAEIDKESYLLRALITDSGDSRVVVEFSQMKANPTDIDPALFDYKPGPKDVVHRNP